MYSTCTAHIAGSPPPPPPPPQCLYTVKALRHEVDMPVCACHIMSCRMSTLSFPSCDGGGEPCCLHRQAALDTIGGTVLLERSNHAVHKDVLELCSLSVWVYVYVIMNVGYYYCILEIKVESFLIYYSMQSVLFVCLVIMVDGSNVS